MSCGIIIIIIIVIIFNTVYVGLCNDLFGLFIPLAFEHAEQLRSEALTRQEIKKKIGYIIEIEQQMRHIRIKLILDRVYNFALRIAGQEQVFRMVQIARDLVIL